MSPTNRAGIIGISIVAAITLAASIYCWRNASMVVARASLAKPGMKMMPIAIIAFKIFVPRLAMRMTASRIAGKENNSSISRISAMSMTPPK